MLTPTTVFKVSLLQPGGIALQEGNGSAQPGRTWASLQELINSAPALSRIELGAGTYRERLYIDKPIHLVAQQIPDFVATSSQSPPSYAVIFDGANATGVWNDHQAMVQIENTRQRIELDRVTGKRDSFQVLIQGIEFRNNGILDESRKGQSAGISINKADAIVADNHFHDLDAYDGAALLIQGNSQARVINNLIWDNQGIRWGAILDTKNSQGNIYAGNSFRRNTSKEGSALFQDFGAGFFLSNLVDDNESYGSSLPVDSTPLFESKGAVMLRKDSTLTVALNRFTSNEVLSAVEPNSGALNIETEGTTNNVFLNVFAGNKVSGSIDANFDVGRGGAIGVFNQSRPQIKYNLFSGNIAAYGGSAIASSERAVPTIASNAFINNQVPFEPSQLQARNSSGTLFFEGVGESGTASEFETANIYNNYFLSNQAPMAADIFVGDQAGVSAKLNTFSNAKTANPSQLGGLDFARSILIVNNKNDSNSFQKNTYISPDSSTAIAYIGDYSSGDIELLDESFAIGTNQLAYESRFQPPSNTIPFSVDGGSSRFTPLASANQGSLSFPLQGNPGYADKALTALQDPLLLQDFEGFNRKLNTVNGAYELSRGTEIGEMNTIVWRFSKPGQPVHFYTANKDEKDQLIAITQKQKDLGLTPDWELDGPATNFNVSTDPLINYGNGDIDLILDPVYRLFNTISKTHLYTMDQNELYDILTFLPSYNFEGIAFYALPNAGSAVPNGAASLQRFLNKKTGSHFYTADAQEFQNVFSSQDQLGFSYDGPSFLTGISADSSGL